MELKIIYPDEDVSKQLYASDDCIRLIESMNTFYSKHGFNPPWAGYFVIDNEKVVGTGGFAGIPEDGKVEIAYWTFKAYEGNGVSSFTCQQLILIARDADPTLTITAKTAPEENISTRILRKNGFTFSEVVQDEDIGDAWLWIL